MGGVDELRKNSQYVGMNNKRVYEQAEALKVMARILREENNATF